MAAKQEEEEHDWRVTTDATARATDTEAFLRVKHPERNGLRVSCLVVSATELFRRLPVVQLSFSGAEDTAGADCGGIQRE